MVGVHRWDYRRRFFGWVIGRLSFKVRGAYFVIVTVSFAEVMRLVALNWVSLTQGPMALTNIPRFTLSIQVFTPGRSTARYPTITWFLLLGHCPTSLFIGWFRRASVKRY